jgi:NarL family two-component system response regulator LiaR
MNMSKIKVLLVDDDLDWLKLTKMNLNNTKEQDIEVIETVTTAQGAVELVKFLHPDIVLMEINLSGNTYDGFEASRKILSLTNTKVIIITVLGDNELILNSCLIGACEYLNKATKPQEMVETIRRVYYGESKFQVIGNELKRLKNVEKRYKTLDTLTSAQKIVFSYIEQGFSDLEISKKINREVKTVQSHVSAILKELGVKNRKEAINKIKFYD